MSRPWMPLYVSDFLTDTTHLDAAETGAYLLLIMAYWVNGSLPQEDHKLARIARLTTKQWNKSKATIKLFFGSDWKHARIDRELAQVVEISNKRKDAALQKHSKCSANAHANAPTLHTSHSTSKKDSESAVAPSLLQVMATTQPILAEVVDRSKSEFFAKARGRFGEAGGEIAASLLKAKGGNIWQARDALEKALVTDDAETFIRAIIHRSKQPRKKPEPAKQPSVF